MAQNGSELTQNLGGKGGDGGGNENKRNRSPVKFVGQNGKNPEKYVIFWKREEKNWQPNPTQAQTNPQGHTPCGTPAGTTPLDGPEGFPNRKGRETG